MQRKTEIPIIVEELRKQILKEANDLQDSGKKLFEYHKGRAQDIKSKCEDLIEYIEELEKLNK